MGDLGSPPTTVANHFFTFIYIYIYIHTHTHTHTYIYIYIYIYIYEDQPTGIMVRVITNVPGSFTCKVIPKTQNWYLMPSWLTHMSLSWTLAIVKFTSVCLSGFFSLSLFFGFPRKPTEVDEKSEEVNLGQESCWLIDGQVSLIWGYKLASSPNNKRPI